MSHGKRRKFWSPYLAGGLAGALGVASVVLTGKFFGASSSFVVSATNIVQSFAPEHVANLDYYKKHLVFDWQWMFVLGIFFGSLIAAIASKTFELQAVPKMWKSRFGEGTLRRLIVAFTGGFVAIIGARLADWCPSGHGLSGLVQLSVSGFVSLTCFFIGGLVMARILYGGKP